MRKSGRSRPTGRRCGSAAPSPRSEVRIVPASLPWMPSPERYCRTSTWLPTARCTGWLSGTAGSTRRDSSRSSTGSPSCGWRRSIPQPACRIPAFRLSPMPRYVMLRCRKPAAVSSSEAPSPPSVPNRGAISPNWIPSPGSPWAPGSRLPTRWFSTSTPRPTAPSSSAQSPVCRTGRRRGVVSTVRAAGSIVPWETPRPWPITTGSSTSVSTRGSKTT